MGPFESSTMTIATATLTNYLFLQSVILYFNKEMACSGCFIFKGFKKLLPKAIANSP